MNMTASALTLTTPHDDTQAFMPIMRIEQAVTRYNAIVEFAKAVLKEGKDFGTIPGTPKPTLYKPGAEKLNTLFGYTSRTDIMERVEDWSGETHGGEPFFYYLVKCQIWRGDLLVSEGIGSCNSWEKKYRYAQVYENKATAEEKAKGKLVTKPGKGGSNYSVYILPNPNICDTVNTLQKMAEKRAYVDATLKATNASDMYTQDLEDIPGYGDGDTIEAEFVPQPVQQAQAKQTTAPTPKPQPPAETLQSVMNRFTERINNLSDADGVSVLEILSLMYPDAETGFNTEDYLAALDLNDEEIYAYCRAIRRRKDKSTPAPLTVVEDTPQEVAAMQDALAVAPAEPHNLDAFK